MKSKTTTNDERGIEITKFNTLEIYFTEVGIEVLLASRAGLNIKDVEEDLGDGEPFASFEVNGVYVAISFKEKEVTV